MTNRLLMIAALACATVTTVAGQAPIPKPSADSSPAIVLTRELALEEQLQVKTDQLNFVMDENASLRLQVQQLEGIAKAVLENMRADRTRDASTSRTAVARKLVTALGGDPDKNDRWDWERRGLARADGTFVPLESPAPKTAEVKQ